MDEITISFRDLFWRIVRKWKIVILCMLAGALLLNGYAYRRETKRLASYAYHVSYDTLRQLSAAEKNAVDDIAVMYWGIRNHCQDMDTYLSGSVLMNLDPTAVPTLEAPVRISPKDPDAEKASILAALVTALADSEFCRQAADLLGLADPAYVNELVQARGLDGETPLRLAIIGRSRQECEDIFRLVEDGLPAALERTRETFGDFDFLYTPTFSVRSDTDLLFLRTDILEDSYEQRVYINNTIVSFNSDQRSYLQSLDPSLETSEPGAAAASAAPVSIQAQRFFVKYILAGAVLGAAAVCFWVFLTMLFDRRLASADLLKKNLGLTLLGEWTVPSGRRKLYLDRLIDRLSAGPGAAKDPAAGLLMASSLIQASAEKNNWKQLFVTGSLNSEAVESVLQQLSGNLEGKSVQVAARSAVADDPSALDALTHADAVVLVEQINASRLSEIKKELDIISQMQIPVLGCIVLR